MTACYHSRDPAQPSGHVGAQLHRALGSPSGEETAKDTAAHTHRWLEERGYPRARGRCEYGGRSPVSAAAAGLKRPAGALIVLRIVVKRYLAARLAGGNDDCARVSRQS